MKYAEDSSGASAPASTPTPASGGPSPASSAMPLSKPPSVGIAAPPPRPLGGGGGMPSLTKNLPKMGSLVGAFEALDPSLVRGRMGAILQGMKGRV